MAKLRRNDELQKTSNSRVYKMLKRFYDLSCSYCRPHRGENLGRNPKHGVTKPKYKDHKKE